MSHTILTDILIIFIVAVPVAYLFHKLKLPPIIGFLVTGALIGPFGFGFIGDINRINLLAQIGVALLLFSLGLEFSLKHFGETKTTSVMGGILQIVITILLLLFVSSVAGFGWKTGIFLGCAISLSSTSIVYSLLSQKRLIDSPHGRISIGILIIQDLSVVVMIALLPMLVEGSNSFTVIGILVATLKVVAVFVVFILGQKYLLGPILHHIALTRSKELFLTTILVLALGFGYITNALGLSFALGAFLSGLMLADTDFRFHALSEIAPFRYCFNGLFFVSVGMLFNPAFLMNHWILVVLILIAIPICKAAITSIVVFFMRYPVSVSVMTGLSLSQIGEFSFLLTLIAIKAGLISNFVCDFMIAAAFLTIVVTPVIMNMAPSIANAAGRIGWLNKIRCAKRAADIDAAHLSNHVIICGFGPLGSSVGHILEQAEKEYIVLELNPSTVRRLRFRDDAKPVYLGDGASAEILYKSGIERASVLAVTAPDYMNSVAIIKQARVMNSKIKIITRAKFRNQVEDLYSAGADIVISEELEAGIEMGRYILLHMGFEEVLIEQYIQTIRAFGSADFF